MQLPRVRLSVEWVDIPLRFSMRHLMIVLAIVALALGLAVIGRRRGQYLRLANYHAQSAQAAVSLQNHLTMLVDRAEEEARTTPWKRVQWVPTDGQPAFSRSLAEHAEHLRARGELTGLASPATTASGDGSIRRQHRDRGRSPPLIRLRRPILSSRNG